MTSDANEQFRWVGRQLHVASGIGAMGIEERQRAQRHPQLGAVHQAPVVVSVSSANSGAVRGSVCATYKAARISVRTIRVGV